MGFMRGDRSGEAPPELSDQQKWAFINLKDFKAKSCGPLLSYMWLWMLGFIAVAVYVADTFTAVKLLVFHTWSSEVKPSISFNVSRWIFAICIILSWTILFYEWQRALRVMRRGGVAGDYMDPLAVKLQSMRFGTGWRRFLVFAELTKSKKKATWVALFVYFQRKGCIRLLAAEGPRQVVNAVTLLAVAKAQLPGGKHHDSGFAAVLKFLDNLRLLAIKDRTQAVILSSMAFTLVIWVISVLFLLLALILYLVFLWHHIQNETLRQFCQRKVETRLAKIVKAKVDAVWAKQQKRREKDERKALESGQKPAFSAAQRQPTLPSLGGDDKIGEFMMNSNESVATLPAYTSQPPTPLDGNPPPFSRKPTMPRQGLQRTGTAASNYSTSTYASSSSLLREAAAPGVSSPPLPDFPPALSRSMTGQTVGSNRSFSENANPYGPSSRGPGLDRTLTSSTATSNRSYGDRSFSDRPYPSTAQRQYGPPIAVPPLTRPDTAFSQNSPMSARTNSPLLAGRSPMTPITPYDQRIASPLSGPAYEMNSVGSQQQQQQQGPSYGNARNYAQRPPMGAAQGGQGPRRDYSAPNPAPARGPNPYIPQRSATAPVPVDIIDRSEAPTPLPQPGQFQRSQTSSPGPYGAAYGGGWR